MDAGKVNLWETQWPVGTQGQEGWPLGPALVKGVAGSPAAVTGGLRKSVRCSRAGPCGCFSNEQPAGRHLVFLPPRSLVGRPLEGTMAVSEGGCANTSVCLPLQSWGSLECKEAVRRPSKSSPRGRRGVTSSDEEGGSPGGRKGCLALSRGGEGFLGRRSTESKVQQGEGGSCHCSVCKAPSGEKGEVGGVMWGLPKSRSVGAPE